MMVGAGKDVIMDIAHHPFDNLFPYFRDGFELGRSGNIDMSGWEKTGIYFGVALDLVPVAGKTAKSFGKNFLKRCASSLGKTVEKDVAVQTEHVTANAAATQVKDMVANGGKVCDNAAEGMPRPHDHHILYEKGIGKTQQALVKEGSEILERYGIIHATDAVNRVIAPNIKGQHIVANLEEVLNGLKEIEAAGGTKDDVVKFLRRMGEKAANRR